MLAFLGQPRGQEPASEGGEHFIARNGTHQAPAVSRSASMPPRTVHLNQRPGDSGIKAENFSDARR
jgi:hypothetical protein